MIPYAPRERFTQPNRISDLTLRAAEGQADAQMRSGQIWGNAIGNVGKIASNAVLDYGEAKAQKAEAEALSRRDQAFMGLLDSSGGNPDPKEILRIFGPREGLKVAEGLQAFQSLGQKKGEQALADLPKLIGGMNAVGERMRTALYPSAAAAIKQTGLFPEGAIPDQYDPNFWKEASAFVAGMTPGAAPKTREIRVRNADGSESIKIVEDKPSEFTSAAEPKKPDSRSLEVQLAEALANGDQAKASSIKTAIKEAANAGRAPDGPAHASFYEPKLIVVDGKEIQANYNSKTGKYHDPDTGAVLAGIQAPPTADMRNKAKGRELVKKSVDSIKALSQGILTKVGPAQRAEAIKRGAETVFGMDPAFRTYQDARTALAGNLAVAQQGSRPSDADVKTVWLPLVPDPYRDTAESAAMKWKLIEEMSNIDAPKESAPQQPKPDGSKPGPGASSAIITTPDGKKWKKIGGRMVEQK